MSSNYENKFFDWSIVCGYYAMYHATQAALWLIGIEARRHDCASAALEFFFVEKGKLTEENVKAFDQAKQMKKRLVETLDRAAIQRVKVEYGVVSITSTEADWIIERVREFVEEIEDLVYDIKGFKTYRL